MLVLDPPLASGQLALRAPLVASSWVHHSPFSPGLFVCVLMRISVHCLDVLIMVGSK